MDPQIKIVLNALPTNCRERSTVCGLLIFLACAALWALSLAGMVFGQLWESAVLAAVNGLAVSMLFVVGHDACHGSLTTSRAVNRWIGTLSFLPSYHSFASWAKTHNGMHHVWTNLKGEDPVYAPFSLEEFRNLSLMRRALERCYRTPLGLGLFYFVEVWVKYEMFPTTKHRPGNQRHFLWERLLIVAFLAAEALGFYSVSVAINRTHPVLFAACAILVPYAVFVWVMGFVTYQHHTHPEIPWFDRHDEWSFFQSQVAGTTHVQFPRIIEILLLNILDHSAHHINPLIPLYRLHESQQSVEKAFHSSIKIVRWTPRTFRQTVRACKLYDYREHRWMDFNGNPTTPRLVTERFTPEPT